MMSISFDLGSFAASMDRAGEEVEDALVEELIVAAGDVVEDLRRTWPRRTGRSAEGFDAEPLPRGARITNPVPYVPHVHRSGIRALALDELGEPLLQAAINQIPERAAAAVARRQT